MPWPARQESAACSVPSCSSGSTVSCRIEATYYHTALLLGLVQGDAVHRWAERLIEREPAPPHEILELVLIPATDLSAMRHALWPLVIDPEPPEVLRGIL